MPNRTLADGQLATAAAAIITGTTACAACPGEPAANGNNINVNLFNTSASLTETVVLTFTRTSTGTSRTIARAVLLPNESAVIDNIGIAPGDTLLGSTTDATTVDYVISSSPDPDQQSTQVFDANGAAKSSGSTVGASLAVSGAITSSGPTGGGIGYATGAGGAVTQITDRSTGVTLSKLTGAITTDTTSLAAGAEATFTVTNTTVAVGDTVVICLRSGATAATSVPIVSAVAAGSFNIRLTNLNAATADTGASIINFAVIKAVGA